MKNYTDSTEEDQKPDLSPEEAQHRQHIDSINESLTQAPFLSYASSNAEIEAADLRAFDVRVRNLAYNLATGGRDIAAGEHEVKAYIPVARLRLLRSEGRLGQRTFAGKVSEKVEAAERAAAEARAEEAKLVALMSEYDQLAARVESATMNLAKARNRMTELRDALPKYREAVLRHYGNNFVSPSEGGHGTNVAAAIVSEYRDMLAIEVALKDWPTIEKYFLSEVADAEKALAAFEKENRPS